MTVIPHNSAQSVQVSVCSFLQVYHTAILLWLRNIYSDVLLMFLFSPCFCSVFVAVVQDTLPHAMCRLQLMGRASEHKIKGRSGSHVLETLLMCSQCVFFLNATNSQYQINTRRGEGRPGQPTDSPADFSVYCFEHANGSTKAFWEGATTTADLTRMGTWLSVCVQEPKIRNNMMPGEGCLSGIGGKRSGIKYRMRSYLGSKKTFFDTFQGHVLLMAMSLQQKPKYAG